MIQITIDQAHARILVLAELQLRKTIRRFFENMPEEEKRRYKLLPGEPALPETEAERNRLLHQFAYKVIAELSQKATKRDQVIVRLKSIGITVSESTPVTLLYSIIVEALKTVDPQYLLEAGVYGQTQTISDVARQHEYLVNQAYKVVISNMAKEN